MFLNPKLFHFFSQMVLYVCMYAYNKVFSCFFKISFFLVLALLLKWECFYKMKYYFNTYYYVGTKPILIGMVFQIFFGWNRFQFLC